MLLETVRTTFERSLVARPGHVIVMSMFGLPAALRSSPGILLEMVWATFYKSQVNRLGNVLSMFSFACSFAKVVLYRHAFEDGLKNFL